MGIRTPLQPYLTTALGASEVRLLELADAYRAIASGVLAEPHVIDRVTDVAGDELYEAPRGRAGRSAPPALRRDPGGTARRGPPPGRHRPQPRLAATFPIPVMGKTGTTSDFRDALFVGSTYGTAGITVAVRIGFDDNRPLGRSETGGRTALPIFREIMLRVYKDQLVGPRRASPARSRTGSTGTWRCRPSN